MVWKLQAMALKMKANGEKTRFSLSNALTIASYRHWCGLQTLLSGSLTFNAC